MYLIPPKKGRYIILDTETTGLKKNDHVVELGANEILDGKLTGAQFHIYIKPRLQMEEIVIRIHQITNNYYNDFYQDIYQDDKQNLVNFINWVGDSLIFAHNATFDMNAINLELKYWGLNEFPIRFKSTTIFLFSLQFENFSLIAFILTFFITKNLN